MILLSTVCEDRLDLDLDPKSPAPALVDLEREEHANGGCSHTHQRTDSTSPCRHSTLHHLNFLHPGNNQQGATRASLYRRGGSFAYVSVRKPGKEKTITTFCPEMAAYSPSFIVGSHANVHEIAESLLASEEEASKIAAERRRRNLRRSMSQPEASYGGKATELKRLSVQEGIGSSRWNNRFSGLFVQKVAATSKGTGSKSTRRRGKWKCVLTSSSRSQFYSRSEKLQLRQRKDRTQSKRVTSTKQLAESYGSCSLASDPLQRFSYMVTAMNGKRTRAQPKTKPKKQIFFEKALENLNAGIVDSSTVALSSFARDIIGKAPYRRQFGFNARPQTCF